METVILLIFCGALGAFSIWCFKMVIEYDIARAKYNKKLKEQYKNKQKQYIIVEEDDEELELDALGLLDDDCLVPTFTWTLA